MSGASGVKAGRAYVEIGIHDKMAAGLKRAQARLKAFGSGMKSIGIKMAAIGTAAAVPFALSTGIFTAFSDRMLEVRAVTQANQAAFSKLTDTAKTLGATTSFTASQVADGMKYLGMAGYDTQEILAGIPAVLNLAKAGALDLGIASDIASDVGTAFGLAANEVGRIADVLAATASSANTNIEMMGETFKYAAPLADAAGQSLEGMAVAIGAIAGGGVKASMAGTDLAHILKQLADSSAQKRMAQLGVSVADAQGNMRSLTDIMRDLGEATKGMSEVEKLSMFKDIFGRAAKSAFLLTSQTDKINELTQVMQNANGTAAKMAADMDSGIGGAFRRMTSAIEGVAISIGSALEPTMIALYGRVASVAGAITSFVDEHKSLVVTVASSIGAIAGLGVAFVGVGAGIQGVSFAITGLLRGFAMVKPILTGISLVAGTIGAPLLIAAGAVAAIAGAFGYSALAGDTFSEKMSSLKDIVMPALASVAEFITTTWASIVEFCAPILEAMKETVSVAFEGIKEIAGVVWTSIKEIVGPAVEWIRDKIIAGWNIIGPTIKPAIDWMRDAMITAFAAISYGIDNWRNVASYALIGYVHGIVSMANQTKYFFTDVIPAYLSWFCDNWRDIFQTIWNGIKSFSSNVWTNLENLWDAIAGLFKGEGWDFEWTGLMDGFESTLKEMPNIAKREITGLEKELKEDMDALGKELAKGWEEYKKDFENKVGGDNKPPPEANIDPDDPNTKTDKNGYPVSSVNGGGGGNKSKSSYGSLGFFNAMAIGQTIASSLGSVSAITTTAGGKLVAADGRSNTRSPDERIAKASEETAKNTKEIVDVIEQSQLVFT